jgi:MFS family permease
VVGLLATLLVLGTLSDYLGRRPVLAAAIALEAVALLVFLRADGVTMLLIARLAHGIATGMALPALGAALVDFNPPDAAGRAAVVSGVVAVGGLAFGALACSALVQYAPRRGAVWALVPVIVASWALGGLYLSLGPSAVVTLFGMASHFFGGLKVALLCGTGAAAAFCAARPLGPGRGANQHHLADRRDRADATGNCH